MGDSVKAAFGYAILALCAIAFVVLLIVGGFWIDRTYFYPQQRANIVANPNKSIANRQFFHDQLNTILTADQNIQSQQSALNLSHCGTLQADTSVCPQLETDMIGLQQIRSKDIGDYNAASDNADTARDRDSCLPQHIDSTESIPTEITNLEHISAACPAPTNQYYP